MILCSCYCMFNCCTMYRSLNKKTETLKLSSTQVNPANAIQDYAAKCTHPLPIGTGQHSHAKSDHPPRNPIGPMLWSLERPRKRRNDNKKERQRALDKKGVRRRKRKSKAATQSCLFPFFPPCRPPTLPFMFLLSKALHRSLGIAPLLS